MKCPIDGEPLSIAARNGIEIDYCPSCRGIWLDRGELDKIIERSAEPVRRSGYIHEDAPIRKEKRKKGVLHEILDFLD